MARHLMARLGLRRTSDRRSEPRQTLILRVGLLAHERRTTYCLVKNISTAGAQVKLYGQIAKGTEIDLKVGDEDGLAGRIAWVKDAAAGIEFHSPVDAATLLRAVQRIPTTKRRSSPRVTTVAQTLLRTNGRTYPGELRNISATGARIQTLQPIRPGPAVMVTLPDLPPIRAFVRWHDDTDLGLVFETPLPIQIIAEWVSERVHVSA